MVAISRQGMLLKNRAVVVDMEERLKNDRVGLKGRSMILPALATTCTLTNHRTLKHHVYIMDASKLALHGGSCRYSSSLITREH